MATDLVANGPWDMADQRRLGHPHTDADTRALVDEIVDILIVLRCPLGLGDAAAATVSVLASLEAEITCRLPGAVADARDQGYTWNEIAVRLAPPSGPPPLRRLLPLQAPAAAYTSQPRHVRYTCIPRWHGRCHTANPFVNTIARHRSPLAPSQTC